MIELQISPYRENGKINQSGVDFQPGRRAED
jgi:hypothetical protein